MVKRTLVLGVMAAGGAAWWLGPSRMAELWEAFSPETAMVDLQTPDDVILSRPKERRQVDVPAGALASSGPTMVLTASNLRSGAGVSHDVVRQLQPGERVEAVEKGPVETIAGLSAPWWRVLLADGTAGWLFGGSLGSVSWTLPADALGGDAEVVLAARFDGQGELQVGVAKEDHFHLARMGTFVTPTETLRGARIALLDPTATGMPLLHVSVGDDRFEQWWLPTTDGLEFVARTEFVEEDIGYTATAVEFRPRQRQVVVQDILGEWVGMNKAEEELTAHVLQLSANGVERVSSSRDRRTVTRERQVDTDASP